MPEVKDERDERTDEEARDDADLPATVQTGGTRGSSSHLDPEHSGNPEKDEVLRVNGPRDQGSRSTQGEDPTEAPAGDTIGRESDPPRGPLPAGTSREDYVGGSKPHQSARRGRNSAGASGKRNKLL